MSKIDDLDQDYPSPEIRVGKLDTIEAVRNEMAKLYRAARKSSGTELDAATAAKLAYLLNHIAKSIEGAELEKRISELEKRI
jgi:hypothetical protein